MADSKQEIFPHIPRPETLAARAVSIQARNSKPPHFQTPLLHPQFSYSSSLSHPQYSHPEPARLVFENVHEPRDSRMPYGEMGNVVMQSPGTTTDQYVVLIGNIPWKEKWQDLKDLVREWTPNVERAEIYMSEGRSRGFGYVRIKGLESAKKVQEKLDGYIWDGRALVAKLGNLEYDCPVGGNTIKLGPGQNLSLHCSPAPITSHNHQNALLGTFDWHGSTISASPPSNIGLVDLETWYHHTYRTYMFYNGQANFHINRSKEIWTEMTNATRLGRLTEMRELQKQFNAHRDAGRQAGEQAMFLGKSVQMRLPVHGTTASKPEDIYSQTGYLAPAYGNNYQGQVMMPGTSVVNAPNYVPGSDSSGGLIIPGPVPRTFTIPAANTNHVPSPIYVTPPNGLPVNLIHGVVQTECRSVFIGNLPYGVTWRELKDFLEGSTRVEVPRNADNRAKGHAIATFETVEVAKEACLRFNNTMFKGRQLRVRMDRHHETKKSATDSTARTSRTEKDVKENNPPAPRIQRGKSARNIEGSRYTPPVVVDGSKVSSR